MNSTTKIPSLTQISEYYEPRKMKKVHEVALACCPGQLRFGPRNLYNAQHKSEEQ